MASEAIDYALITNPIEMNALPMWCDEFDMDLPKILRDAQSLLGDLAELKVFVHCYREPPLNHPTVWNTSLGAVTFVGRSHPRTPPNYDTTDPIISCTLWQLLRDAWAHQYTIYFDGNDKPVWIEMLDCFVPLMNHVRKQSIKPDDVVASLQEKVVVAIEQFAIHVRNLIVLPG